MKNTESQENYLEAILMLSKKRPAVRIVDVAEALGFKEPSVSIAIKKLREKGCVEISSEGYILLLESGKKIAAATYEKHEAITRLLVKMGVDAETAESDACKIEHVISKKTFLAMKKFAGE